MRLRGGGSGPSKPSRTGLRLAAKLGARKRHTTPEAEAFKALLARAVALAKKEVHGYHWVYKLDGEIKAALDAAPPDQRAVFNELCVALAAEETAALALKDRLTPDFPHYDERKKEWTRISIDENWAKYGGCELDEPLSEVRALNGSPVRLVDARFLVILAQLGGRLVRRQDLPEAAFVPLEKLRRIFFHEGLPIVCISHPWLQPDHPDPFGDNLRLVALALDAYLLRDSPTLAVFLECVRAPGPRGLCRHSPLAYPSHAKLHHMHTPSRGWLALERFGPPPDVHAITPSCSMECACLYKELLTPLAVARALPASALTGARPSAP